MVNDDIGDYGRIIIKVLKGGMKTEKKKTTHGQNRCMMSFSFA